MAACASCGELQRVTKVDGRVNLKPFALGDFAISHLVHPEGEFRQFWLALPPKYRAAHHIVLHDGKLFAVAPALIDPTSKKGWFCTHCLKLEATKRYSRFLNFDYGISMVRLPRLSTPVSLSSPDPFLSLSRIALPVC